MDGTPDGAEVGVTFTAELPGMQTKAIGDGLTAKNLTVEVYEDATGAAGTNIEALHQTATFTALKTDVKFNLVKGKTYHFIFWAQADNAPYTLDAAAKTVAISYAGEANDESRDAFYAVKTLKVQGPATEPVQLKRPFAQVNFGTADFDAAKAGGVEVTQSSFTATDAATSLDLFAGEGVGTYAQGRHDIHVYGDELLRSDRQVRRVSRQQRESPVRLCFPRCRDFLSEHSCPVQLPHEHRRQPPHRPGGLQC